ncbi:MAG: hgd [Lachnospiraceae bacterium]|jgi:2-hydroxymethylglutarate dehydrogenase|nr:hgd [Lachnospiraceae bacterium]
MNIGFIGLGAMGGPMAENLVKANHNVFVYDVSESAREMLEEKGATNCSNVAVLAENADVILVSLPNSQIVESTMLTENGVFANAKKGAIIIDMSSVSPTSTKKLETIANDRQLNYVDAPVSGGVAGAKNGTLTIMVGAKDEVMENILPILNILGKNIYHVGETGLGDTIKIVNNLLLGCNMVALAEAVVLGQKSGLSPETMYEIVKMSSGNSYVLNAKMEKFILPEQYEGGFAVNLQHKDLGLALELGNELDVSLPFTTLASQIFEAVKEKGMGNRDISYLVKHLQELSN